MMALAMSPAIMLPARLAIQPSAFAMTLAFCEPNGRSADQQRTVVEMLLMLRIVSPQPPSGFWLAMSHWTPFLMI